MAEYWETGAPADHTCPTCRIPFRLSDITPMTTPTMDRFIKGIQFFCENYCKKVITKRSFTKLIQK